MSSVDGVVESLFTLRLTTNKQRDLVFEPYTGERFIVGLGITLHISGSGFY